MAVDGLSRPLVVVVLVALGPGTASGFVCAASIQLLWLLCMEAGNVAATVPWV
jgi:hypothetical protein